ncbi:hypothetical protein L2E82_48927 [Cichorium intybus]|uniref:Uncharacterized protein n=1 Tax=Cichorium intybus TaxID=13427 RepID=A0ACB8Z0A0_CICIN|nr:hypothetical protein L2E82_48927 [Cichorium intybus]
MCVEEAGGVTGAIGEAVGGVRARSGIREVEGSSSDQVVLQIGAAAWVTGDPWMEHEHADESESGTDMVKNESWTSLWFLILLALEILTEME